jgi:hypothetical protein
MNAFKWLLVSIVVTLVGACTTAPSRPSSAPVQQNAADVAAPSTSSPTTPVPSLPSVYTQKGVTIKIEGLWQAADGKILGVSGTAKNVTASDLRFCLITLVFRDQTGSPIDAAKASTKSLKSAQIWHFQAALSNPSQTLYSSIAAGKVIAIPVKNSKPDLASLK